MGGKRGFDFAGLDPVAANLDLVVAAAQAFQPPLALGVDVPAREIAGTVATLRRNPVTRRPVDERRRGALGIVEIAGRDAGTADIEFAYHTGGDERAATIDHMTAGIGDGRADTDILAVQNTLAGRPDGGFRRPVHIPQREFAPRAGQQIACQHGIHGLATHHGGEAVRRPPFSQAQQPPRRRRGLQAVHVVGLDQPCQTQPVEDVRIAGDHYARAHQQRAEQFQHRDIEGERGHCQQAIVAANARALDHRLQEVHHVGMGQYHALRLTARAGGKDHIGGVIRRDPRPGRCRVARRALCLGLDIDKRRRVVRQRRDDRAFRDHAYRPGNVEYPCQPRAGVGRIAGHIGRPQALYGQGRNHQVLGARQEDGNVVAWLDATARQPRYQRIDCSVERGIAQLAVLAAKRDTIRFSASPPCHGFVDAAFGRQRGRPGLPLRDKTFAIDRRKPVQRGQRGVAALLACGLR